MVLMALQKPLHWAELEPVLHENHQGSNAIQDIHHPPISSGPQPDFEVD
ncbi:hypothetical protein EYF80_065224 [Liparis tanakae]|uniref:Uncharacterized protein n=1 Tax=Liparis tanakae TaxID=230148 RepID=A0A4Z2E7B5_9TELE|nr:hypothetical protein EYF80_065224 [Liparis tanakae]